MRKGFIDFAANFSLQASSKCVAIVIYRSVFDFAQCHNAIIYHFIDQKFEALFFQVCLALIFHDHLS